MKLNFWQWVGVVLLIVAVIVIFRTRMGPGTDDTVETQPQTTTSPTALRPPTAIGLPGGL